MNIYKEVVKRNIPHQSHESDLYIPVTDETRQLLTEYEYRANVTIFINQVEGGPWYDIPFAYAPFWEKRERRP